MPNMPIITKLKMAAPLRNKLQLSFINKLWPNLPKHKLTPNSFSTSCPKFVNNEYRKVVNRMRSKPALAGVVFSGFTASVGIYWQWKRYHPVLASSTLRPKIEASRQVRGTAHHPDVKLTLYQFQSCPFCCKVRALLDYRGFSYDVVEVNSVTKKQLKWSEYKKVPTLVVETPSTHEETVLRESSVIISVLESHRQDERTGIAKLNTYFPCLETSSGRKKVYDFPNKYFIMFQEKTDIKSSPKEREEERKWRRWADDHLVHMLSPNVYRTVSEALQSFHYFSEVGEWEKHFSSFERYTVIYLGAAVMYFLGWMLKHKYKLKDDVRESLYDACNEWVKAVGKKRPFMGGDEPNLADLAVFGVLSSIEGCTAFQELLDHTKIRGWYTRTKQAVTKHQGALGHR